MIKVNAKLIGADLVNAKLLASEAKIAATNRALVTALLKEMKPIVVAQTPIGPGHFGYHGRDTVDFYVKSKGVKTTGVLAAAVQLRWREYGTRRERARMTAHKAARAVKRFVSFYYGGMAKWWGL